MRILLINQTFYPDVAATAQHGHDLARHLVAEGHEVSVIASRSIYGKAGPALPARETVDGIEIHRVGRSIYGKAGLLARTTDFAIFYLHTVVRALMLPKHDICICFTTPPFIALLGLLLRMVRGTRFVYWVMDLYPDVLVATGVLRERSITTRLLDWVNGIALRGADATVVLGRCMERRVLGKGVDRGNLERINVWSDLDERPEISRTDNAYRREWAVGDRVLVMYSGNFGIGHDVATFVDGMERLASDPRIVFAFIGDGKRKPELLAELRRRGLSNFIEADYQPRERLAELLSAADVHLASMQDGWAGVMVPSKLYGTLAVGRPVVWVGSEESEAAFVIREADCGRTVRPGDGAGFADAVRVLASDEALRVAMGARARQAMFERWDARHALARWSQLLGRMARDTRGA